MSAIITTFPGPAGTCEDDPEGSALIRPRHGSATDPDRVAQLVALYKRLGQAPLETLGAEAVESILHALDEGREQDAFDMLEIALEDTDEECAPCDDEINHNNDLASPVPHAAVTWRHLPRQSKKAFSVVGGPESQVPVKLRSQQQMTIEAARDWRVTLGDLEFGAASHRASLELGLKGDLFLLLLSGSLVVRTGDGKLVAQVTCLPGERRLVRVIYCTKRSSKTPVILQLECVGDDIAQGIWCHSGQSIVGDAQRKGDPEHQDTFCTAEFLPVTDVTDSGAFCEGAMLIKSGRKYAHGHSEARGDFTRFSPPCDDLSVDNDWVFEPSNLRTRVVGMAAAPQSIGVLGDDKGRELTAHEGHVEVMIAAGGASWIAIAAERGQSSDDDPPELRLPRLEEADGAHTPAFVTPLVTTADGGCDVLILKPSYPHTVWITPGSASRFFHFMFGDPELVVPKPARQVADRARAADRGRAPAARAAGRS